MIINRKSLDVNENDLKKALSKIKEKGNPDRSLPQESRKIKKYGVLSTEISKKLRKIEHRLLIIDPHKKYLCKKKEDKGLSPNMFPRFIRSDELIYIRNIISSRESSRIYYDTYADNSFGYTVVLKRTEPDVIMQMAKNLEKDFPVKCFIIPFIADITKKPIVTIKLKVCFFTKSLITHKEKMKKRKIKEESKQI